MAGEVAAREAVEQLALAIQEKSISSPSDLRSAINQANAWVYSLSQKNEAYNGMGTTLCCLLHAGDTILYAHVGDSRIYRLRNQELQQLTRDHSLLAKWQSYARVSHTPFPYKNVITRAIGTAPKTQPDIATSDLLPDDLFLLCSDGLSDTLSLQEMQQILLTAPSLDQAAHLLVKTAKEKGGADDMTLVLIQEKR